MLPVQVQSILFALLALVANAYTFGVANAPVEKADPTPAPMIAEVKLDAASSVSARPVLESPSPETLTRAPVALAEPINPAESEKPSLAVPETIEVVPVSRPEVLPVANADTAGLDAWEYLSEIGFGAEYGSSAPVLHKWREDVRIKVHGKPSEADMATLEQVTAELGTLIPELDIQITDRESNVDIHFMPETDFTSVDPHYVPVNLGFFRVWWDSDEVIYRGRILISTEGISQQERSHLIREELTQTFGLFMDSWQYEDSIFYQGWTSTVEYSPLDREVIRLLYSSQLDPGMRREQVSSVIAAD